MNPNRATKTFERNPVPRAMIAIMNNPNIMYAGLTLRSSANLVRGSKDEK